MSTSIDYINPMIQSILSLFNRTKPDNTLPPPVASEPRPAISELSGDSCAFCLGEIERLTECKMCTICRIMVHRACLKEQKRVAPSQAEKCLSCREKASWIRLGKPLPKRQGKGIIGLGFDYILEDAVYSTQCCYDIETNIGLRRCSRKKSATKVHEVRRNLMVYYCAQHAKKFAEEVGENKIHRVIHP